MEKTLFQFNTSLYTVSLGGERGQGPPTGKFTGPGGLGQFWGAEFKNRWYTGDGRGLWPLFHVLFPRFHVNSLDLRKKYKITISLDKRGYIQPIQALDIKQMKTVNGRGFQPRFHDLQCRFYDQHFQHCGSKNITILDKKSQLPQVC